MSKDLIRSILASIGSAVAIIFGLSEEIVSALVDNVVMIITAGLAVYQIVLSGLKPADDDEPRAK
jgi:hypothetical protein